MRAPTVSGPVQRRSRTSPNAPAPPSSSSPSSSSPSSEESEEGEGEGERGGGGAEECGLTLMDEVLLLGLKERSGYTSPFNDCLSAGLRGCILLELALRGRLGLEEGPAPWAGPWGGGLPGRKVVVRSDQPTGDALLDETLRLVREKQRGGGAGQGASAWVELLSGDSVNPLKRRWRLRNVRLRLAKGLVEKGVLTTRIKSFLLFDMTTHPLAAASGAGAGPGGAGGGAKRRLVQRVRHALLDGWAALGLGDPSRRGATAAGRRATALLLMAHASDVTGAALDALPDRRYDLATRRLRLLAALSPEAESRRPHANHMMWAVMAAFNTGGRR